VLHGPSLEFGVGHVLAVERFVVGLGQNMIIEHALDRDEQEAEIYLRTSQLLALHRIVNEAKPAPFIEVRAFGELFAHSGSRRQGYPLPFGEEELEEFFNHMIDDIGQLRVLCVLNIRPR